MAEQFPEKSSLCRKEHVCHRVKCKRIEWSDRLISMQYKNISLPFLSKHQSGYITCAKMSVDFIIFICKQ